MKDWLKDTGNSVQKSTELNEILMDELQNFMIGMNKVDIGGFYFQIDANVHDLKDEGNGFIRDIRRVLSDFGSEDSYSFSH